MAKNFMKNLFGRGKNAQLIGQIVLILLIILAVQLLYPILKKHFNIFEGLENGKEFVFFHMNGCGHCNNMKPEWEKFSAATSFTTRSSGKYWSNFFFASLISRCISGALRSFFGAHASYEVCMAAG